MMILRAVNAFIVKDVSLFTNNFIQNATFLTLAFMMVISAPSFLLLMKEDADIKLEKLATLDSLTMIPNRRHFMEHAYPLFNKHVTTQLELTTLFLDIDHFKNVNDQFGHSFGDEVLIECSRIIQENVRGSDISCRYGGEEFLIMLHQTNSEGAVIVANHIRDEISKFVFVSNPNFKYTISIGVFSKVPTQTDSIEQFIDFADQALYRAKATGRDKICVYKKGLSND
jgi:diguanylate cyclase (GGDEF)-like protein